MSDKLAKNILYELNRIAESLESIADNINEVVYEDKNGRKYLRIDGFVDVKRVN